jgi:hypothetical protein
MASRDLVGLQPRLPILDAYTWGVTGARIIEKFAMKRNWDGPLGYVIVKSVKRVGPNENVV